MRYRIITRFNGYEESANAGFEDFTEAGAAWLEDLPNAQQSANSTGVKLTFMLRDMVSGTNYLHAVLTPVDH